MGSVNLGSNSNINADISRKPSGIQHFAEFSSGAGSTILKADNYGFFVGGTDFQTAPWAVDYEGKQYLGANGEIVLDGPNKKITVGTGGLIQTDYLKDSTYGYNGVFVKQIKLTSATNPSLGSIANVEIGPDNGGLLTISANYKGLLTQNFLWLTPVNHFYAFKSGGKYYIYHHGVNIVTDTNADTVYYTVLFNSLESGQGY